MTKEDLRSAILSTGAVAAGFAAATTPDAEMSRQYRGWIEAGMNAGMDYLVRHAVLRDDTDTVLPGARTVICAAYSYAPSQQRDQSLHKIATYALGNDYHDIVRKLLAPVAEMITARTGERCRICIDSAPVAERYWAVKSGIGYIGRNGAVITEKGGSYVFLAEILTTAEFTPDPPAHGECAGCGACLRACPGQAIRNDGTIDSARCISYLTIEHRGSWEGEALALMRREGRRFLYGCDLCLRVCPHNRNVEKGVSAELRPRPEIISLTAEDVSAMTQSDFNKLLKGSPIKRCGYAGLMRNALNCLTS